MNTRSLIIILITIGILGVISSFLVMGGSFAHGFNSLKDGRAVTCTVTVNAPVFGENLLITQPTACHGTDPCFVSLSKSYDITRITGELGLWQSGQLYATQEVDQSRFASAKTYTINACIPQEASAVRIGIITKTGGVVNDQAITIQ